MPNQRSLQRRSLLSRRPPRPRPQWHLLPPLPPGRLHLLRLRLVWPVPHLLLAPLLPVLLLVLPLVQLLPGRLRLREMLPPRRKTFFPPVA